MKARFLPPYVFARGNQRFERAIDRGSDSAGTDQAVVPGLVILGVPGQRVQLRRIIQYPAKRGIHANRDRRFARPPHHLAARIS